MLFDMSIFEDIAENAFKQESDTESMIAKMCGVEHYSIDDVPRYEIYIQENTFEKEAICDICGQNKWAYNEGEFICDHSRDEDYYLIGMFVGRVVKETKVTKAVRLYWKEE